MSLDEVLMDAEEKMEGAVEYLKEEFRGIRTGRASAGLVDHLKVDYYGAPTDLRQLASISAPEATLLVIKPFDPSSIKDIEKAIYASDIGITPQGDGKLIRLMVPPLSGERRVQIVGQLKKMAEAQRVAIRNARRDGNKGIDKLEKDSEISEDDSRRAKDQIQKLTGDYEKTINDMLQAKTKEIQER